jgi:LAO/AO transport system kinase
MENALGAKLENICFLCLLSGNTNMDRGEIMHELSLGNLKALARCITIVENELEGHKEILKSLVFKKHTPVIGITGPPGAGKSTLINALINHLTSSGKKIGIVAVDPTSPFNYGSLLGDRLRMSEHFNNPSVFIRSIATRGSLGGLSGKIMEITDVMKASDFDYIIVETVGVGQSEVEIAGLADTTILVLVPEGGDEIQTIKSGIMEIADIYVVNKGDREGAEIFVKNLLQLVHSHKPGTWLTPVLKITATKNEGITKLAETIDLHYPISQNTKKKYLLTEKAYRLIQSKRMHDINKQTLLSEIEKSMNVKGFNIYSFAESY